MWGRSPTLEKTLFFNWFCNDFEGVGSRTWPRTAIFEAILERMWARSATLEPMRSRRRRFWTQLERNNSLQSGRRVGLGLRIECLIYIHMQGMTGMVQRNVLGILPQLTPITFSKRVI